MRYRHVCIESFGYSLPEEIVTTAELEQRLAPLYERLRLPEGRLELMSGIRERRFWPVGTRPSEKSIESAKKALEASDIHWADIGALVHASVCRDYLEPATACRVHDALGLPEECVIYDVSNACLGILNGMVQVANMIELGQIKAGLVVGTESGRDLVETTVDWLNRTETLSRNDVKLAVASLTIGSASAAVLLTHSEISRTGHRLVAAATRAHTAHHQLCHGDHSGAETGMLMTTDSERLLNEGVATGVATFRNFRQEAGWTADQVSRTFCHQIGSAHRKAMLQSLELSLDRDFTTFEWLGNTGSAALPVTMAIGLEKGLVQPGDKVAMLGIGSGINCIMLGAEW
jgi:acyl-CoA:acyl-CoA alkyltransferase